MPGTFLTKLLGHLEVPSAAVSVSGKLIDLIKRILDPKPEELLDILRCRLPAFAASDMFDDDYLEDIFPDDAKAFKDWV